MRAVLILSLMIILLIPLVNALCWNPLELFCIFSSEEVEQQAELKSSTTSGGSISFPSLTIPIIKYDIDKNYPIKIIDENCVKFLTLNITEISKSASLDELNKISLNQMKYEDKDGKISYLDLRKNYTVCHNMTIGYSGKYGLTSTSFDIIAGTNWVSLNQTELNTTAHPDWIEVITDFSNGTSYSPMVCNTSVERYYTHLNWSNFNSSESIKLSDNGVNDVNGTCIQGKFFQDKDNNEISAQARTYNITINKTGVISFFGLDNSCEDYMGNASVVSSSNLLFNVSLEGEGLYNPDGANRVCGVTGSKINSTLTDSFFGMCADIMFLQGGGPQLIAGKEDHTSTTGGGGFEWEQFESGGSNFQRLRLSSQSGNCQSQDNLGSVTIGQWTHVCVGYDGNRIRHYDNGVFDGSDACSIGSTPASRSSDISIGRTWDNTQRPNMMIDRVTFYNINITEKVAQDHFNNRRNLSVSPITKDATPVANHRLQNMTIGFQDTPTEETTVGDTTPPIINGTLNISITNIFQNDVINATFNATDNVNLTNGTITINATGELVEYNFTFGDNEINPTLTQQISQNFTIGCASGCVVNITGIARDNSSNTAQNETIFTVTTAAPTDNNKTVNLSLFLNNTEQDITLLEGQKFFVHYLSNVSDIFNLTRNGTEINNNSEQNLPEGVFNFTITTNGTAHNFSNVTYFATVIATAPTFSSIGQIPIDIVESTKQVNLTVNITDQNLNTSAVTLFWKVNLTNGTIFCWDCINKTQDQGQEWKNSNESIHSLDWIKTFALNGSGSVDTWQYNWSSVFHDVFDPHTSQIGDEILRNLTGTLTNSGFEDIFANNIILVNVTNLFIRTDGEVDYDIEVIARAKSNTKLSDILELFLCNSSYTTGDITTSQFCQLGSAITISDTTDQFDFYEKIIQANLSGYIGSVKVTENMTLGFKSTAPNSARGWELRWVTDGSTSSEARTSSNDGVTTSAYNNDRYFAVEVDMFSENFTFNYLIQAEDTLGNKINSSVVSDVEDLVNEPPTECIINDPIANDNVSGIKAITWSESISDAHSFYYNISLYDETEIIFNKTVGLVHMGTETLNWDTTTSVDDKYSLTCQAIENITDGSVSVNLSSTQIFTDNFTVDNTPPEINTTLNETTIVFNSVINFTGNITDLINLNTCQIINNRTGINEFFNVTLNSIGDECSQVIDIDVAGGTVINFSIRANDTLNNLGLNDTIITVGTLTSEVNLLLNGTDGDLTLTGDNTINATGIITTGLGIINLFVNTTLNATGPSQLEIIFNETAPKVLNITVIFITNENWTTSRETHLLTLELILVNQTPTFSNFIPTCPIEINFTSTQEFNATVDPNDEDLLNLSWYENSTFLLNNSNLTRTFSNEGFFNITAEVTDGLTSSNKTCFVTVINDTGVLIIFVNITIGDFGIEWITLNWTGTIPTIEFSDDNATWVNVTSTNQNTGKGFQANLQAETTYFFRAKNETSIFTFLSQMTKSLRESDQFYAYLVAGVVFLTLISLGYYLDDIPFKLFAGLIPIFIAVSIINDGFANITNDFLRNSIIALLMGIGSYFMIASPISLIQGSEAA